MRVMQWFAVLAGVAVLSGCAVNRSEVSVEMQKAENPRQGTAVRIGKVVDARRFEVSPARPDMPSVMSEEEVNDPKITARAIARKRNGFGQALGDVLLPEGQSVSKTVDSAVTQGFRKGGYRVLTAGEPGYEQATWVDVRINAFWAWTDVAFSALTLNQRSQVALSGNLPALKDNPVVENQVADKMQLIVDNDYKVIFEKGLNGLARKIAVLLGAPEEADAVPRETKQDAP